MKLIICSNCNSVFTPTAEIKKCDCGISSGRILEGIVYYSGDTAIPIELDNDVIQVMKDNYEDGKAVIETYEDAKKDIKSHDKNFCTKIIEYLNGLAGTSFSVKFPSSITQLIISRRDEHQCTLQDFFLVIARKARLWKGTTMEIYLRPKTLFNKTNFANYLGEKNGIQQSANKGAITVLANAAERAKRDILGDGNKVNG